MQRSSYQKQANVTPLLKLKELPIKVEKTHSLSEMYLNVTPLLKLKELPIKVEKTHSPSEMYLNLLVTKAVFLSLKNNSFCRKVKVS